MFLYLYILETLNNRKVLTDEKLAEFQLEEGMTEEKFIRIINEVFNLHSSGEGKSIQDEAVDAWFNNAVSGTDFKKNIDFINYIDRLMESPLIKNCVVEYNVDNMQKTVSRKLNDYTHNNGIKFLANNIISPHENEKVKCLLESAHRDISFITSHFLIILTQINQTISHLTIISIIPI